MFIICAGPQYAARARLRCGERWCRKLEFHAIYRHLHEFGWGLDVGACRA